MRGTTLTAAAGAALIALIAPLPLQASEPVGVRAARLAPAVAVQAAPTTAPAPTAAPAAPGSTATAAPAATTTRLATKSRPAPLRARTTGRASRATASATVSVTMGDFFFDPETVTIDRGDTVTWTNEGTAPEGHTVTGEGFDSGVIEEGESYSHQFTEGGSYEYICALHDNMTGTVVVRGPSGTGGGGENPGGDNAGGESGGGGGTATDGGAGRDSGNGDGSGGGTTGTGGISGSSSSSGNGGNSGGSLAFTGANLVLLFEIGVGLLAGGLLARRLLDA